MEMKGLIHQRVNKARSGGGGIRWFMVCNLSSNFEEQSLERGILSSGPEPTSIIFQLHICLTATSPGSRENHKQAGIVLLE